MMKPVPNGAMALAGGETEAPALPEAAASEAAPEAACEAAASEDSAAPHAETQITAPMKSVALEPPRLKMFRPTVGGFIPLFGSK